VTKPSSRLSITALLLAIAALLLAIAATVEASAHHPGSHANRSPDGMVRVEVAVAAADSCTRIEAVGLGAPAGVKAPAGSQPVTVTLAREPGLACAQVVSAAREETSLPVPVGVSRLHLFVVGPDGQILSTERVPVR
jgi:hypothetical protein